MEQSPPPPVSTGRAEVMLVLVTVFWGLSFPLMKSWQEAAVACPGGEMLSSATLIALRMSLALAVLAAFKPRLVTEPTRREHAAGLAIGLTFLIGFLLQVWGLAQTTPARSAFITSLSSAWVPLLAFVVLRTPVAGVTLLGLGIGIVGAAALSLDLHDGVGSLGTGEARTLLASVLFAVQVLLLDRLGRAVRSSHVTVAFLGLSGGLAALAAVALAATGPGLASWGAWVADMFRQPVVVRDFLLVTLLPTVLAFHWMNAYQPYVSAGRAALIYLLEPVFGSFFSVLWGHDELTARLFLGGGLILGGNLLVELPYWLRVYRGSS